MTNPTTYTTSSSSSQYNSEPRYKADPVAEYARILYEHTRQQMDNAALQQQEKATSRDIPRHHQQHNHLDNSRATARV